MLNQPLSKSIKRKKVYYVHFVMERIGHLAGECLFLRNAYPLADYDIEIFTYPFEEMTKINRAVFDIATRGITVTPCYDKKLLEELIKSTNTPVIEDDEAIYNLNFYDLLLSYNKHFFKTGEHKYKFSLNDSELERGSRLRKQLNIPLDAKIVTLHVREPGYLPNLQYHSFRDANILNYVPAIEFLIKAGYYVIRIGDNTMKKVPVSSNQFIDGPFSEYHCDFFDPYFISQSEFYIGMLSGPYNLAQGFNIPMLIINGQIAAMSAVYKNGLFAPKQVYSEKLKRFLTYPEILHSPIVDFYLAEHFSDNDLQLVESTPDEIMAICKEMTERLNGNYSNLKESIEYQNTIKKIHKDAYTYYMAMNPNSNTEFCLHLTNTNLSVEFLKRHPSFLGLEPIKF